jgi:hypothetical protein
MKDVTPEHLRCTIGACPSVHELPDGKLLLIVGLRARGRDIEEADALVGATETAIIIDRALLANVGLVQTPSSPVERLSGHLDFEAKAREIADAHGHGYDTDMESHWTQALEAAISTALSEAVAKERETIAALAEGWRKNFTDLLGDDEEDLSERLAEQYQAQADTLNDLVYEVRSRGETT